MIRIKSTHIATIFLFWVTLFISSCSTSLDHKNPYDVDAPDYIKAPASITGRVILEGESNPQNVTILIQGKTTDTISPADDGTFTYNGLIPGKYEVTFSAKYHNSRAFEMELPIGGNYDFGNITIPLKRYPVEGRISLEEESFTSTPAGTTITLIRKGDIASFDSATSSQYDSTVTATYTSAISEEIFTTIASINGEFSFNSIPSGIYEVLAQKDGYAPSIISSFGIGSKDEKEGESIPLGTIILKKLIGDFEILGYLAPSETTTPVDTSNRYTYTDRVKLIFFGFNAERMNITNTDEKGDCNFEDSHWEDFKTIKEWQLSTGNGSKSVCVKFEDSSGKESTTFMSSIILDSIPPVIYKVSPIETSLISYYDGIYYFRGTGNIPLEFSVVDNTSGVESLKLDIDGNDGGWYNYQSYFSTPLTGEGPHTLTGCFRDHAHNITCTTEGITVINDYTPPQISSLSINDGNDLANTLFIPYTLEVTDDYTPTSGLLMRVAETDNFEGTDWQPFRSHGTWFASGSGDLTLYFQLKDRAGNISDRISRDICIDTQPPDSPMIRISDNREYIGKNVVPVEVSVRANSLCLTQEPIYVEISTTPDFSSGTGWSRYDPDTTYFIGVTDESEGLITIYARFLKPNGMMSDIASTSFIRDITPPMDVTAEVTSGNLIDGKYYTNSNSLLLRLSASDQSPMKLIISDDPTFDESPIDFLPTLTYLMPPGDGTKHIYIRFMDEAGNYTDMEINNIVLDTTPPQIPSLMTQPQVVNSSSFQLEISSGTIDENFLRWECQGGKYGSFVSCGTDETRSIFDYTLQEGTPDYQNILKLRAVDKAGNVGDAAVVTITYDDTPPTTPSIRNGSNKVYVNSDIYLVEITRPSMDKNFSLYQYCVEPGDASLCTSGYIDSSPSQELPIPLIEDSEITVFVRGKDEAGNTSGAAWIRIEEDSDPPTPPIPLSSTLYTNTWKLTLSIKIPSTDQSLAIPNEDNFDHYEIFGGINCETHEYYNNDDIGKITSIEICLSFDNGIPQLDNKLTTIKIYGVDKAGNRSYPATINVYNEIAKKDVETTNDLMYVTDDRIVHDPGIPETPYRQFNGTDGYYDLTPLKDNESYGQTSILQYVPYTNTFFASIHSDNLSPFLWGKVDSTYTINAYWSYMFPLWDNSNFDVKHQHFVWITEASMKVNDTPPMDSNEPFQSNTCYFDVYTVTSPTTIYGFYHYLGGSYSSLGEKLYGVIGYSYDDGYLDIRQLIDLSYMAKDGSYYRISNGKWVFIPVNEISVGFGKKIFMGICTGDLTDATYAYVAKSTESLPYEMSDLILKGHSITNSPCDDSGCLNYVLDTTVSSDYSYPQRVMTEKDHLMEQYNIYYVNRENVIINSLTLPFQPEEIKNIKTINVTVNGYDIANYKDYSLTSTSTTIGNIIKFNDNYLVRSIYGYLTCSEEGVYIHAALYESDSKEGPYTKAFSAYSRRSIKGFNLYSFWVGEYIDPNKYYIAAIYWDGVTCTSYNGRITQPVTKPYGTLLGGAYGLPDTITITDSNILFNLGLNIVKYTSSCYHPGIEMKGKNIIYSLKCGDQYKVGVIDSGNDYQFSPDNVTEVTYQLEGEDLTYHFFAGKLDIMYKGNDDLLHYDIHDFGDDGKPGTDDDIDVFTRTAGDTLSRTIVPTMTGHVDINADFMTLSNTHFHYRDQDIYSLGDNWLHNISPFMESHYTTSGFIYGKFLYGDKLFFSTVTPNNKLYINNINTSIYYPVSNTSFDTIYDIEIKDSRGAITTFKMSNLTVTDTYLHYLEGMNLDYRSTYHFKGNIQDIMLVGKEILLLNSPDPDNEPYNYILINPDTSSFFFPSNITSGGLGSRNAIAQSRTDSNKFIYSELTTSGTYLVHIYDLGEDGIHSDEGSFDDSKDSSNNFPIEELSGPEYTEINGEYFGYYLPSNHEIVYGKIDGAIMRRDNIAQFFGVRDGIIVYTQAPYYEVIVAEEIDTGEQYFISTSIEHLNDFVLGKKDNNLFLSDWDTIWYINYKTGEVYNLAAGSGAFYSEDHPVNSFFVGYISPDNWTYFPIIIDGKGILYKYQLVR